MGQKIEEAATYVECLATCSRGSCTAAAISCANYPDGVPPQGQITKLIVWELPQALVTLDLPAGNLLLAQKTKETVGGVMFQQPPEANATGAGFAEDNPGVDAEANPGMDANDNPDVDAKTNLDEDADDNRPMRVVQH